jgi:hypothetical protein
MFRGQLAGGSESFAEANERLVARLRNADHRAAEHPPAGGGWSAARPLGDDFRGRGWTAIASEMPSSLKAPASFSRRVA